MGTRGSYKCCQIFFFFFQWLYIKSPLKCQASCYGFYVHHPFSQPLLHRERCCYYLHHTDEASGAQSVNRQSPLMSPAGDWGTQENNSGLSDPIARPLTSLECIIDIPF